VKTQIASYLLSVVLCGAGFSAQSLAQATSDSAQEARQILRVGIEASNADVRVLAITAASMIGKNDSLRSIIEAKLQDKEPDVRIAAIKTLAELKADESIPALTKVLNEDTAPDVAFEAAKALFSFQNADGKQALLDVFNGTRQASAGKLNAQKRSFLKHFRSFGSAGMFLVTTGAGFVPIPGAGEGATALVDLTQDASFTPRAATVLLLGKEKNAETDDLLKRALSDKDWTVRAASAQMIAFTGRVQMRSTLAPLFDDTEQKVRFRAAAAYLHLAVAK
jgi:HEAT repeat protein